MDCVGDALQCPLSHPSYVTRPQLYIQLDGKHLKQYMRDRKSTAFNSYLSTIHNQDAITRDVGTDTEEDNIITDFLGRRILPRYVPKIKAPNGNDVYILESLELGEEPSRVIRQCIQILKPHVLIVDIAVEQLALMTEDEDDLLDYALNTQVSFVGDLYESWQDFGIVALLEYSMNKHTAMLMNKVGKIPGQHYRQAYREVCQNSNCQIELGKRSLWITLQRAANQLSVWDMLRLLYFVFYSQDRLQLTHTDIEDLHEDNILDKWLELIAKKFPSTRTAVLHEQEEFLALRLRQADILSVPQRTKKQKPKKPRKTSETSTNTETQEEVSNAATSTDSSTTQTPLRILGLVGKDRVLGVMRNWKTPKFESDLLSPERVRKVRWWLFRKLCLLLFTLVLYAFVYNIYSTHRHLVINLAIKSAQTAQEKPGMMRALFKTFMYAHHSVLTSGNQGLDNKEHYQ